MIKIKLMNKIAKVGTDVFSQKKYEVNENVENESAIMVRSASLHETVFGENVRAIARCGAGVNNIPIERCTGNPGCVDDIGNGNIHVGF